MKVKAIKSFATIHKTAMPGEIFNVESDKMATDLIEAGYVEAVVVPEKSDERLKAEADAKAAAEQDAAAAAELEKKRIAAEKKAEKERIAAEKKAAAAHANETK